MNGDLAEAGALLRQAAHSAADTALVEINPEGVAVELPGQQLRFVHSFVSGSIARRIRQPEQLLLKACNNRQRSLRRVLDLTAGWGIDALILARHGQCVTSLEQNRLLHAITAYSLTQLATTAAGTGVAERITLHHGNALDFLQSGALHQFDCIYLDPMFAAHKSGAKPGKEMQILQALTDNLDIEACFRLALSSGAKRVVVKRAARAPSLMDTKPDLTQRAKTIRFDIYLPA